MEEVIVKELVQEPGLTLRPGFILEVERTAGGDYQTATGLVIARSLAEPVLSLRAALAYLEAQGAGVCYGTLFAALQAQAFPHAVKVESTPGRGGAWRVPLSDLRAYRNTRLAKKGVGRG